MYTIEQYYLMCLICWRMLSCMLPFNTLNVMVTLRYSIIVVHLAHKGLTLICTHYIHEKPWIVMWQYGARRCEAARMMWDLLGWYTCLFNMYLLLFILFEASGIVLDLCTNQPSDLSCLKYLNMNLVNILVKYLIHV